MKKYFKRLSEEIKKIIKLAAEVSKETKMPAFLVGGFVRDLILEIPNLDLDITVQGSGIAFAKKLAKKLKSQLKVHDRFATATLILNEGLKVDIATTRKEKYFSCALLPEVSLGSLAEDLKRRDFTINAMAVSIAGDSDQKLIDPFAGKDDLLAGKIRILHDLSFEDDPTRILRAVRFQQRLSFKIEPKTLALLKRAIAQGLLDKVSPHRMRDNLILMLKEQDPLKQMKRLGDLGGLAFISRRLKIGKTTQDLFRSVKKEILRFNKNFPTRRKLDVWLIYFAALLKPLALFEIKKIILRLGLRKGEGMRIISYAQMSGKPISYLSKNKVSPTQIFSTLEPLSYETIILLMSTSQNKYLKKNIVDFFKIYNGMRLYVSGDDLGSLGVLPGPKYQTIFTKVLAAKLNGRVKSRQEELILVKKLIKK